MISRIEKTAALIQARMNSTRLPGKVLKPIQGISVIEIILHRLMRALTLDEILVVTSLMPEDDVLAEVVAASGVRCFRGDEDDVLDRYYQAAAKHGVDHIVRLTGDCPLIDPQTVDKVVESYHSSDADLVSNQLSESYPDGLDVCVFSFESLRTAWMQATLPSDREHVVTWIINQARQNPSSTVQIQDLPCPENLFDERWTLDEPDDYQFFLALAEVLPRPFVDVEWLDVLKVVRRYPEIRALNSHIRRNEGYEISLAKDECLNQKPTIIP